MTSPAGETRYDYLELIPLIRALANRGNLVKLTNPSGEVFTFTYDSLSRRTKLTRPNNTESQYQYNPRSELLELKHLISSSQALLSRFAYTYDDSGNRRTREDSLGLHTFTYDALNRLTQAQAPNPESYTYDGAGNRLTSHLSPLHLYDASNRLLEDTQFTYTYDANGNLIQKQEKATAKITQYTYDPENQLIRIDFPDGTFSRYFYDALGRRIQKRSPQGQITLFIYDAEDILLEFNQLHQLQKHYTHGPGIDEPLQMARDLNLNNTSESSERFFYHADGLGSVTDLTDTGSNLVQSYVYDSFGNLLNQSGSLLQPYTYTGRELDPESNLYYFRARYYDPRMGRFIGEDKLNLSSIFGTPLAQASDGILRHGILQTPLLQNKYLYVNDNPLGRIDPFGLWYIDINIGIGYVIGPLGLTGGVLINDEGVRPYVGFGLASPGPSAAITYSPSDPTEGWNVGFQFGFWGGGQFGVAGGEFFWEAGVVTPGSSLTAYFVSEPIRIQETQEEAKATSCPR